jgi:lipase maturation factor 1
MNSTPLLIFDGHCGFCRIWIEYWKALTAGRVEYAPSQDVGHLYPQIPEQNFRESVQLVMPDGEVSSGARAVATTLTYASAMSWALWAYEHLPWLAPASEAAYRVIATHRNVFYHLTRWTFGKRVLPWKFAKTEWLFRRLLAIVYLIAFASLAVQITGLIGPHGILPLGGYLTAVSKSLGARGYWSVPTIFWIAHGDRFLKAVCWGGVALALLLLTGIARGWRERLLLAILYVLYLSICTAGQDFLSFQWDSLLLETGFLAIFLGNSKIVVLLFRWLIFRLMFLSGSVKLTSHDPVWRDWTALAYHYMTQPLPGPTAWFMHQLPLDFQRFSTAVTLFVELAIPFLFFAPRMWRLTAAAAALFLQTLIFLTGNYTFFNLLTISLCIFLFDDRDFRRFRLREHAARTGLLAVVIATVIILVLSVSELEETFLPESPEPASALLQFSAPFQIANTYGLFASMTLTRPEIIVQGSDDGVMWIDYQFRFKPGDLTRLPGQVAPYQPRLDWQMWFAALSDYRASPWFVNFMLRLLQGSPDVLALLGNNPFPNAAPKFVRAELFDYSFTNFATHRATGDWWSRVRRGMYFPAISISDLRPRE